MSTLSISIPESLVRIAAFSDGRQGGNPAGVLIADKHPTSDDMQAIAAAVGYSETAFAMPAGDAWRVRYFSPESEVPFCGHATIALGAALARQFGSAEYVLKLNDADITVRGDTQADRLSAALQSPATWSEPAPSSLLNDALQLLGYPSSDLDPALQPALANAGAKHLVVGLNSREALANMTYDLDAGRTLMRAHGLVTILLAWSETPQRFHTRNPFASGGVYEDPATGAATAAFAGYLRDIHWPHNGDIEVIQGEDMGCRSLLRAQFDDAPGTSIRVSGNARMITADEEGNAR